MSGDTGALGSDYDPSRAYRGANGPSGSSGEFPTTPIVIGGVGAEFNDNEASRGANGPSGPAR